MLKAVKPILILALSLFAFSFAQEDTELVVARGADLETFDPHNHDGTIGEAVAINIWDYLVFRNENGELEPSLATSWSLVSDTEWNFKIREGVLFHNGQELTAEDVKFSLDRIVNDETLIWHDTYSAIERIDVLGRYELAIVTKFPDPVLLSRISRIGSAIVPRTYIEQVGWNGFATAPIGTGPYKFVSWQRDDRLVLEAFAEHWRGAPAWDRVVFRTIPEASTRVSELVAGGVDVIIDVPAHEASRIAGSGATQVIGWPTNRIMSLIVNTLDDGRPTSNPLVREAIDFAIDDQLIIDVLFDGNGTPTLGRVNPGIQDAPMDLFGAFNYDPERAQQLLEEAGYGPGELTIKVQGPQGRYAQDREIAELLAVMLEQVGIVTELEVLEWGAFSSRIFNPGNIEHIALIGLANSMFDGWYANRVYICPDGSYAHRTNWCNDDFDSLNAAAEFEMNAERRQELLREAFYILADERPQIALFQVENLAGTKSGIVWQPRPDELLWVNGIVPARD